MPSVVVVNFKKNNKDEIALFTHSVSWLEIKLNEIKFKNKPEFQNFRKYKKK